MNFPKFELNITAGSVGTVLLDGVDISNGLSGIEYKAVGGELAVVTLTFICDVEARLEVEPECLKVARSIMPEDGAVSTVRGHVRHYRTNNGSL